jgi:hypothetical protein
MPQVFSADAQQLANPVNVGPAATVTVLSTNPLQPPFQTAKAKVIAFAFVVLDPTETEVSLELIRNPQSEAVVLGNWSVAAVAGQLNAVPVTVAATDQIPDPRQVSYALVVIAQTNTGDNQVVEAYIEATLISG